MKNDGKYLEEAVETELIKFQNDNKEFKYRRLPDARAAHGRIPAQPADFFVSNWGDAAHIECKTSKSKTLRLPKFSQHTDMLDWALAGVAGIILVHFYVPDRLFMVEVRSLAPEKPSWVFGDGLGVELNGIEEFIEKLLEMIE